MSFKRESPESSSTSQLHKYQTIEDGMMMEKTGILPRHKDDSLCDERMPWYLIAILVMSMFILSFWHFLKPMKEHHDLESVHYEHTFDSLGRYVMHNFDEVKPMSNFLPALGGIWGYPMWAFYVNRGQGITAFGVDNKDGAIAKFNTAEKAYQQTPFTGFRTFVKGVVKSSSFESMPFGPHFSELSPDKKPVRTMNIDMNELEITERDPVTNLRTSILYFTSPHEEFACLIRRVTFTNEGTDEMYLEVLDGLAKLEPAGIPNGNIDSMGRTMEAWMNVYNMGEDSDKTQPFYHASQGTADTAEVQVIKEGHFALAFVDSATQHAPDLGQAPPKGLKREKKCCQTKSRHGRLPFIVDPNVVFGADTVLVYPSQFFGTKGASVEELMEKPQGTTSRTPCAYTGTQFVLKGGENISIVSIYGHASSIDLFTEYYTPKLLKKGYVDKKRASAAALVNEITERVDTNTSSILFNEYIKQNFLDNVLRGGLPIQLGATIGESVDEYAVQKDDGIGRPKIYHVFSRIHGDLERDYNNFDIDTTFFSQGPGNFRDVNQNRRSDVIHTPVVGDFNLRMFLSFIQADGYNPLTVAATIFRIPENDVESLVTALNISDHHHRSIAAGILSKPFRPGKLLKDLEAKGVVIGQDLDSAIFFIMSHSHQVTAGQFAQNGFWTDHWTYTLDLVKTFIAIFPDKEEEMLWDSEELPFFMSPAVVRPRSARYELVDDEQRPGEKTIRVYKAVSMWGEDDFPETRRRGLMKVFKSSKYVASSDGSGGVWQQSENGNTFTVSPITKLSMLALIKFSTMDPYGMGVEMEGGKPGWNDAMNGLPGIIGSGMAETYELLLIVRYVRQAVRQYDRGVSFPEEFSEMMNGLSTALRKFKDSSQLIEDEFEYWDQSNNLREEYRHKTEEFFSGSMVKWSVKDFIVLLDEVEAKTLRGISRALESNGGISPTYFYYECVEFDILENGTSTRIVVPRKFNQNKLPLFLEGTVRYLKTINDVELKREAYQRAKSSDLYDANLQMFKLSGSLKDMGQEIGRMMAFSPGWLENESVWLHMSYKFYLELLRGKLYDAFYLEIKTGLVPFMDPEIYGRSPLEAASFIVSSVFPDENLRGASFDARLSGSTAEFLSMWELIMQGPNPFMLNKNGELTLSFSPAIARWLFKKDGTVSFIFLGACRVTYHNPLLLDTWNIKPVRYELILADGSHHIEKKMVLGPEMAKATRNLKVKSIDVFLG